MAQQATPRTFAPPAVIQKMQLGVNKYTDPTLTNPTQWYDASNVFSGPFGYIQRARFAHLITSVTSGYTQQNADFLSLFNYYPPVDASGNAISDKYYILGDINGLLYSFDTGNNFTAVKRLNPWIDPTGAGSSDLDGPWMRQILSNILYEVNGTVKQSGRGENASTIEVFGLDAPDASPAVTIEAGATANITSISRTSGLTTIVYSAPIAPAAPFTWGPSTYIGVSGVADTTYNGTFLVYSGSPTGTTVIVYNSGADGSSSGGTIGFSITKSIGRSYAYAWENANKAHVSAPSPSTQYFQYSDQVGVIDCLEPGTLSMSNTSPTVTGVNTLFSTAWVGRYLFVVGQNVPGLVGPILSVQSDTELTLAGNAPESVSSSDFNVYDYGTTHIRLYATADGGATYYRVARNSFAVSGGFGTSAGYRFYDGFDSEPPNAPFTTEESQLYNISPPIGKYLYQYMGQLIMFGVSGATQSFFYSNQGLTTIGLPQESFAPLNQMTLPIQGANIGGMAAFPSSLIVWDDKEDMFRITGLLADNTTDTAQSQGATVTQLPFGIGCANPFAVAECPLGAIWLSPQNELWLYTDYYAPRNIGRSVQDILNGIDRSNLGLVRATYYHTDVRDWVVFAVPYQSSTNNKLLILDVDLLASNGSPSFFLFDMATNHPSWYVFDMPCPSIATEFQADGTVSLISGSTDDITNLDFQGIGGGTEYDSVTGYVKLHAFGNDTPFVFKRPQFFRFLTNMRPSSFSAQGWKFSVDAFDDDKYTFGYPLTLALTPGVNDTATLSGHTKADPLSLAESFRYSQARFRIGAINFIMGRRFQFQCTFPTQAGSNFQWYGLEMGYAISPPR